MKTGRGKLGPGSRSDRVLPIGFIVVQRIRIAVTHKDLRIYHLIPKGYEMLGKDKGERKKWKYKSKR